MIVAVCGGKGGVGKSTMALNLGRELDAVVVDGDLTTADLPRGRGPDIHDVLTGRVGPLDAVERIGSVQILPGGRTLAGARAADLTALEQTVALVERRFGRVVIDCPAGLARDVGIELYCADLAVLVTNPEKTALVDAIRTRKLALEVDTPIVRVVLNRANKDDHGTLAENVEKALETPTTVIETRSVIAEAQAQGLPVHDVDSAEPVVETLGTIGREIEQCDDQRLSVQ